MELDTIELPSSTTDAFQAGLNAAESEVIEGQLVHHESFRVTDISKRILEQQKLTETGPQNRKGKLICLKVDSLVKSWNDYATDHSQIFADLRNNKINIIFDYHQKGENKGTSSNGWGQFSSELQLNKSRKLKEWASLTEWYDQVSFANFLEDHLEDVVKPTGQDLLALATDLEANKAASFKGKMNLASGAVQLNYQEDVQTSVEVPQALELGIPLFEHGDPYQLKVRLRFRVGGDGVKFKIVFTNLEDAIEAHFDNLVKDLEDKTKAEAYRGELQIQH